MAYHAISLGFHEGELMRRVDPHHRSLGQFFQDEIATPLGLDVYVRLPEAISNSRLASLAPPSPLDMLKAFPPTMKAFVTRHPVATYFALTFAISWGGVLLVVGGPGGMTGVKAQDNPLFPFAVLAMVAGPSVTGILLTGFIDGRAGLREFRSRLLTWRVSARWYAVALLAAPLLATAITMTLSLFSPAFLPGILVTDDKAAVLLLGLVVGHPATGENRLKHDVEPLNDSADRNC